MTTKEPKTVTSEWPRPSLPVQSEELLRVIRKKRVVTPPVHKFKCAEGHEPIEHDAWDCPICELKKEVEELESALSEYE